MMGSGGARQLTSIGSDVEYWTTVQAAY